MRDPYSGQPTEIKSHQPTKPVFKKPNNFHFFQISPLRSPFFFASLSYFKVHVVSKAGVFRFYTKPIENQNKSFTGMKIGGRDQSLWRV